MFGINSFIMQEEANSSINNIRSTKRSDLKSIRESHKESLLCNKRLRLNEVSEYVHDVSLSEFTELLLKLKQKPVPLKLLKKIKNCCVNQAYIEALFKNEGAFNSLLRILIGNDAQKQLEAAACFTNLACGSHKCSYKVAKASGVYLISFINGNSYLLQDQSIWALANIASDCFECFNVIKSQGVLPALLKALMSPLSSVVQSAVFALNTCTKYDDPEIVSVVQKELPKHLLSLIEQHNLNKYAFLDAAFAFSNCCFWAIKHSLNIFDTIYVKRIIDILLKVIHNTEVDNVAAVPLIRSIGFLSCDDEICEFLASHTDFYRSIILITSLKNSIYLIKEGIWLISNITVSINIMCNASSLEPLLNNLKIILKQEKSVTLQILYYLSILLWKNNSTSIQLLEHEILFEIKSLIECKDKDISEALRVFLEIVAQQ